MQNFDLRLENQWSIVINEPEGLNLLEDGRLICEQLVKQYPMLEELDSFLYVYDFIFHFIYHLSVKLVHILLILLLQNFSFYQNRFL